MPKNDYRDKKNTKSNTEYEEIPDLSKDQFRGHRNPNKRKTDYERKEKKLDNWQ